LATGWLMQHRIILPGATTLTRLISEIMLMITKGQKVNEISEQLNLSPKTVNSYRYRMFSKLNIHGDVELTHLAIRHGLCNAESLASQ
ncbi:LuxR C-terminal-related transcriptional regulator, partial [Klebsiella pneumoniae]|uniref:LuxR C-terminal-related transcriptional regulator n=1 Tax=Klebsiella pneumoniae TaxID=573 RepID=UPI00215B4054